MVILGLRLPLLFELFEEGWLRDQENIAKHP
jgi:hypothetical protein